MPRDGLGLVRSSALGGCPRCRCRRWLPQSRSAKTGRARSRKPNRDVLTGPYRVGEEWRVTCGSGSVSAWASRPSPRGHVPKAVVVHRRAEAGHAGVSDSRQSDQEAYTADVRDRNGRCQRRTGRTPPLATQVPLLRSPNLRRIIDCLLEGDSV
jgi:hypothetical protein